MASISEGRKDHSRTTSTFTYKQHLYQLTLVTGNVLYLSCISFMGFHVKMPWLAFCISSETFNSVPISPRWPICYGNTWRQTYLTYAVCYVYTLAGRPGDSGAIEGGQNSGWCVTGSFRPLVCYGATFCPIACYRAIVCYRITSCPTTCYRATSCPTACYCVTK